MAFQFHIGTRVQEVAFPHRKGRVIAVQGKGPYARIIVGFINGVGSFSPGGLRII